MFLGLDLGLVSEIKDPDFDLGVYCKAQVTIRAYVSVSRQNVSGLVSVSAQSVSWVFLFQRQACEK